MPHRKWVRVPALVTPPAGHSGEIIEHENWKGKEGKGIQDQFFDFR
jgi:hypothetical protein